MDAILAQDYLYCGAGSPSYAVRHLADTRAYEDMKTFHRSGGILSVGSATAIAFGRHSLPVYEIFKVGAYLHGGTERVYSRGEVISLG